MTSAIWSLEHTIFLLLRRDSAGDSIPLAVSSNLTRYHACFREHGVCFRVHSCVQPSAVFFRFFVFSIFLQSTRITLTKAVVMKTMLSTQIDYLVLLLQLCIQIPRE